MSASLVRKALDETSFASDEKLDHLSKGSKKKFKPKNKKKVSSDKLLKQNLKILKALEYKFKKPGPSSPAVAAPAPSKQTKAGKKKRKQDQGQGGAGADSGTAFTDEDFEKFESEYFVS